MVNYDIIELSQVDVSLVEEFLKTAGSSLSSFRYFEKRPLSIIENHLVTCILTFQHQPIGYGHLDKEEDKVWLGISLSDKYLGQGLGKLIMTFLIKRSIELNLKEINLTVDKDNQAAIKLYKSFNFQENGNVNERSVFMVRRN